MTDKPFCPASGCPLVAPGGSPWTGHKMSPCPEHDDLDTGGCPWWRMACHTGAAHRFEIDQIAKGRNAFVIGPNQPKDISGESKEYDCKLSATCSWQKQAGGKLCPPRYALSKGLDPRVCLF